MEIETRVRKKAVIRTLGFYACGCLGFSIFFQRRYVFVFKRKSIVSVRTLKSYNPSPLKIVGLYSSTLTQIDEFLREGIKQQERALPKDENKKERLDMIKYVGKCLNTSTPEEAVDTKNNALFTLFFQCSCSTSSFFWYFFCLDPFLWKLSFSYILSPTFILTPHLYLTRFSVWHLPL